MKRLCFMLAIILAITTAFTGCNYILGESDTLLKAPSPGGELNGIQKALHQALKTGYTLKCAKGGEYRSAVVVKDIDGDGVNEAIAFYSIKNKTDEVLHMAVANNDNNSWNVISDTKLGGTDIERVDFGDMNGDGTEEAVVAWSIYGAPETRISVFDIVSTIPVEMYEGSYSDFCVYDINSDSCDELLVFSADATNKSASCNMFVAENTNLKLVSTVNIDGSLTAYKKIHETTADGKPVLFVDAYKESSRLFTEIICFDGKNLTAPLYEQSQQSSLLTLRYQDIECGDVDGDGNTEIPCMTVIPSGKATQNPLCLTEWKQFTGGKLVVKERSVISGSEQYKFLIDTDWIGKFSCVVSGKNDGTDFYNYNSKTGFGAKAFSLCAVNSEEYDALDYSGWFVICEGSKKVYLGRIFSTSGVFNISRVKITNYFSEKIVED